ncbi:E3 ubiquitin-protein ligase DDB_G0292642-like [Clinocottus analis]|uniref:E3 ubiquitin-protein ligase DDB_G0292642-like n=1 Tax=Clinocottus analis TaxID=304258 RepID=UPI0035BF54F4
MSPDSKEGLRAEMSCGHAVTPESLTGWCRSLLDQGQCKFKCPALVNGSSKKCGAEWSYQEVRRLAMLTPEEMQHIEENKARLAATEYCEFKTCPGCKTYVERKDLSNLNVLCTVCTVDKEVFFNFCWQCLNEWKGEAPRSDRCDNDGCVNLDLEVLKNCKTTDLPQVDGVDACPSIRACPTCGQRVEHDKTGCKNIICPRCQVEFCFVCLKLTPECLKTSSYFIACSDGVAPRQTSIPVWQRK